MALVIKMTVVDGKVYQAMSLMAGKDYHDQHAQFIKLFESSPPETLEKFKNSEGFGDPTLTATPEQMADSENNWMLFDEAFTNKINDNPEADLNNDPVYLLKPSGIFKLTYGQGLALKFPRNTSTLEKTDLNPSEFINQLKDVAG